MAGIQQQLGQAGQRILHEEAQGVLQVEAHCSHQSVQLGKLVRLPVRLIDVVGTLA